MSLTSSPCDDPDRRIIIDLARQSGIDRIGFAEATPVTPEQTDHYSSWLKASLHAGMDYLERYPDIRTDPRLLLPGARTVISCAISYWHAEEQLPDSPRIAQYAHGDDYHDVVRRILSPVADEIARRWGAETRICVDTAPIHERYWALRSGIGFRGRNGLVIAPGIGSYFFLGEIITTHPFLPTEPLATGLCDDCGRCIRECPGHALRGDGTLDCSRCMSYLTIEYRGDFPEGFHTGRRLAGCDRCQQVCPHNASPQPTRHPEFHLRPTLASLTVEQVAALTPETYATLLRRSSLKRIKLPALLRNLRHL
ncbi:MAG: tRNA epoxyqueuosine(34) reductase QueG [Muribaculaceae bacterium]|nr:tRNA epoxyqueuosine(34) reductase QueG [Muribaculaceae bacterium]